MSWWDEFFSLMFKPVQLVAEPSTLRQNRRLRDWCRKHDVVFQGLDLKLLKNHLTCPTGWKEDGRVDVWSFTYNCNCCFLVYSFFNSFLSSQCVSLYHIYWHLLHMSVLPSLYPSLCVSMLLPWGYAPFGGTATEANSGHRPVDEPWLQLWPMAWALVIGVPVPRMTIWRLSEAHGFSNSPQKLAILFWHSGSDTQWLVHFWGARVSGSSWCVWGSCASYHVKMSTSWVRCACSGTKPATPVPWCSVELNPRRCYGSLGKPTLKNS